MNELYETKISTARWMAYDLPGNAGWIVWTVCTVLCLKQGFNAFSVLAALPALFMLTGIAELISEHVAGLDRVLTKKRLYRGFGALTLGGIAGVPIAVVGLISGSNGVYPVLMLPGAALCAVFAGLCFRGYRKRN